MNIDACTAALVIVGIDGSAVARTVNRATGERGFSHAYIDPCQSVDGEHRVVDYSVAHGVHWADPEIYAHRRRVRINLSAQQAAAMWPCVYAKLGKPLKWWRVIIGEIEDTCIGLLVTCLPAELQAELASLREGPCLSPNTLARWAGVA